MGDAGCGECRAEDLSLEPDIEDAGALREQTGECRENERDRQPDRRADDADKDVIVAQLRPSWSCKTLMDTHQRRAKHGFESARKKNDEALNDQDHFMG